MNLKEWVIGGLAVLALVVGYLGLSRPEPVTNIVERVIEQVREEIPVGSASSPSVINGCMDVNGVNKCYFGMRMLTGTTTVCSFKIAATSTVFAASSNYEFGSTSATRIFIAKGTNSNATTTNFATGALTASGGGTLVASTTGNFAGGINPSSVVFPGDYVNFQAPDIRSLGDAAATGARAAGRCALETTQY